MSSQYVNLPLQGGGGGVSSLNSLTGALSLTSSDSTLTITPSGSSINLQVPGGDALFSVTTTTAAPTYQQVYAMATGEAVRLSIEISAVGKSNIAGGSPVASSFTGTIGGGTAVTITATATGLTGTFVSIYFDGVMTISQAIAAWNAHGIPGTSVSLTAGNGAQVPFSGNTAATFTGTPAGCSTPVTIVNNYAGTGFAGSLTGDGFSTISQLIAEFNALFLGGQSYYQTLSLIAGNGAQVPSNGASISLSGDSGTGNQQGLDTVSGSGFSVGDFATWNFEIIQTRANAQYLSFVDIGGIAYSSANGNQLPTLVQALAKYGNGQSWTASPYINKTDNKIYMTLIGAVDVIDWKISVKALSVT